MVRGSEATNASISRPRALVTRVIRKITNTSAEQQIGQPPALIDHAAVPAGAVEEGLEPQLDQEHLPHVADRGEFGGVWGRLAVPDVQVKMIHSAARCRVTDRPAHPGQLQPQEMQRRFHLERRTHPVQVVPRQHEPAQDEEQVDALGAGVEQGASSSLSRGDASHSSGRKWKKTTQSAGDDAETGQGFDLSGSHGTVPNLLLTLSNMQRRENMRRRRLLTCHGVVVIDVPRR